MRFLRRRRKTLQPVGRPQRCPPECRIRVAHQHYRLKRRLRSVSDHASPTIPCGYTSLAGVAPWMPSCDPDIRGVKLRKVCTMLKRIFTVVALAAACAAPVAFTIAAPATAASAASKSYYHT